MIQPGFVLNQKYTFFTCVIFYLQEELENLNIASDDINKLETEIEVSIKYTCIWELYISDTHTKYL